MVGYGIFVSVILATYSNPWGEVTIGYGTSGRGRRVVGFVGVAGVVGVRIHISAQSCPIVLKPLPL